MSHTPPLPPVTQDEPTTTPAVPLLQQTMSHEHVPTFAGTGNDNIQPSKFIKIFHQVTRNSFADEPSWVDGLGNYLKTGSPAETWFLKQTMPKMTWTAFKKEFKKEFLDVDRAEKTPQNLERELLAMRLHTENLGKMEHYAGEEVWTHIAFVQQALYLAQCAGIATGNSNILQVRDSLPDVIREKVTETQTD